MCYTARLPPASTPRHVVMLDAKKIRAAANGIDSLLGPEDSNQVCRLREPSRSVMLQQNDKLSNAPEDGCVQKGGSVSVCAAARHRD